MRTVRLPALLAAALLAGCLGAADAPATTPAPDASVAPPAALDLAWGLEGCRAAVFFADAPGDRVRPHLPEGFEPLPVPQGFAGGGPNPTGGGSFGIEMFDCASGLGLDGAIDRMAYGSYFAFVEPPADLREDVNLHFVKWDVLVPDAPRRDALAALGAPAVDGSVEFGTYSLQGSVGASDGTLALGEATHRISGAVAAPGPTAVTFVEYMPVDGGLLAWRTLATTTAAGIGPGEVTVAEGSLAAEVLGAGTHRGSLMVFEGDFTEGSVKRVG